MNTPHPSATDSELQPASSPVGALQRRTFMSRLFLASGAAAFATMTGTAAEAATSTATPTSSATPTSTATATPTGTPTAPRTGGGVVSQTITEDFFGLSTNGKLVEDLFTGPFPGRAHGTGGRCRQGVPGRAERRPARPDPVHGSLDRVAAVEQPGPGRFQTPGCLPGRPERHPEGPGDRPAAIGLSAEGLQTTENIRRINLAAGQAVGNSTVFNDELYYFTVMGTPSATEPWGFQLDGHHLVVNYFVMRDQVVMSPCFWGSEPTSMQIDGETVTVCQEEVSASLAFIQSLTPAQQKIAIVSADKADENMLAAPSRTTPSSPTPASEPRR